MPQSDTQAARFAGRCAWGRAHDESAEGDIVKVSVVTLSFNQVAWLERAIRSVVEQDHPDIEYIVVDPGSTDGSRDIIARYRDRIATFIDTPDDGPPDGLNKGFAAATGDIYAYLNADDALLPGAVREAVAVFERHPEIDIVIGHGFIVDGAGKVLRRFRSAPFTPRRFAYGAAVAMQQSTFFRASAFKATKGFNAANRTSWDAELLLDMGLAGARIRVVDAEWSLFALHAASISGSQRMADESRVNHERYFRMVMGRAPHPLDAVPRWGYRLMRWLGDPVGAWQRLSDRVFGPPRPDGP
jgi:glycosyltransferase involved in cell wall biosynthesis